MFLGLQVALLLLQSGRISAVYGDAVIAMIQDAIYSITTSSEEASDAALAQWTEGDSLDSNLLDEITG